MLDLKDESVQTIEKSIKYWQKFWDKRGDRLRELRHELGEIEIEIRKAKTVLNYLGAELAKRESQTKEV